MLILVYMPSLFMMLLFFILRIWVMFFFFFFGEVTSGYEYRRAAQWSDGIALRWEKKGRKIGETER